MMMTAEAIENLCTGSKLAGRDAERERFRPFFTKIRAAAHGGQNGSAAYALDRLAPIHALATTALQKLED